jgi:hypothetical protein
MKINIVVPTHDQVPAMFAYDLAQLVAYTVAVMPEDTAIGVTFLPGTYIHTARQELMQHCLANGDDYVLWLDSDMRFPKETFAHLIQHKVPIVGINYAKRRLPPDTVAIKTLGLVGSGDKPERLYPDPEETGLVEVDAVGFGVLLMRMDDFRDIPPLSEGAWFDQRYIPETDQWIGEDVSFCIMLREKMGMKILVDQDLSYACAHIGQFEYTLGHVEAQEPQEA